MYSAPHGARRLLYVAAESHRYRLGSGLLRSWLAVKRQREKLIKR